MVAKSSKQELAILAAANSGLVSAHSYTTGSKFRGEVEKAIERVVVAIKAWPGAEGDKATTWALNRVKQWRKRIIKDGMDEDNSLSCLIYVTMQSLIDIEERILSYDFAKMKIKDRLECKDKLDMIAGIYPHVEWLDNFLDDKGRNFDEYSRGNKILEYLYQEIDFRW